MGALAIVAWSCFGMLMASNHVTPPFLAIAVVFTSSTLTLLLWRLLRGQGLRGLLPIPLATLSLGFIGLGAKAPAPEWGSMISVARSYMPDWWWYSLFPGLAIYLTVLGFNLFGDGLRDILDPKSRSR